MWLLHRRYSVQTTTNYSRSSINRKSVGFLLHCHFSVARVAQHSCRNNETGLLDRTGRLPPTGRNRREAEWIGRHHEMISSRSAVAASWPLTAAKTIVEARGCVAVWRRLLHIVAGDGPVKRQSDPESSCFRRTGHDETGPWLLLFCFWPPLREILGVGPCLYWSLVIDETKLGHSAVACVVLRR